MGERIWLIKNFVSIVHQVIRLMYQKMGIVFVYKKHLDINVNSSEIMEIDVEGETEVECECPYCKKKFKQWVYYKDIYDFYLNDWRC